MASDNHVASRTPLSFGAYNVGVARGVSLGATGNAVVAIPLLGGGLTGSGSSTTSGVVALRKITIGNYTGGNLSTVNVSVGYTNDGANLVANAQILSSITANNQFQDLTLSATGNNTFMNGNVSSTLFLNLVANAVANATVDVVVQGSTFRA